MSGLSFFSPSKLLGSRERGTPDPLARLRFSLDTMPGSRKFVFTPATRAEILSELYDAFWGSYAHMFLPNSNSSLPLNSMLSEVQAKASYFKEPLVTPGRPCGHIFKKGEACFRCKDCALDDSCVLCWRCFDATNHEDHSVSFFIAQQSGGCCDCGDAEAWRISISCPFHPPTTENADYINSFNMRIMQATPKIAPKVIPGAEVPPLKDYPGKTHVPQELRESMARTVGYAIDYLLDTLDYSPETTFAPTKEGDLWAQPSGDPMMMKDQFCVVLWNDDKHSFDEVIQLLRDHTNRTRDEASQIADTIDEQGREIIEMNSNIPRLLELGQIVTQIDLGITIRRAYDTFREQVVAVIIEWLVDLCRSRLGPDILVIREVIAAELLSPRKQTYSRGFTDSHKLVQDIRDPCRLDWMFLYHVKLWRKPRLNLKEVYASLVVLSHDHKLAIASHFASVYHRVIDTYLLVDREAETSIKYFALQLYTVPSVALYLVRHHNIVSRLLSIITSFFTNQIQGGRIVHPPSAQADIDVDTFPFKSKRFMTIFSDLRYLCHNEPVQQLIAHNHEFIQQFAGICKLFMCVNPNKRAATSHVEYETDVWISVFNVTLSLSRVIKVYGEAFARSSAAELVAAITTVMRSILILTTTNNDDRDASRFPQIAFHHVHFGDTTYEVVKFEVMEGWVSFHHSLQWLLAELLKHIDVLDEASLESIGLRSIKDVFLQEVSPHAVQTIVDYPLRVIAMVAQIRAGLWVRNGFAIRGQVMHYRDYMLRELCYDQDLFILQAALVILDPNSVIVSILDRFELTGYFSGATLHHVYDTTQLANMVEEFLYVLITILTEKANATKMSLPEAVRREIVHALALGPCPYTELVKRVAERKSDDVCFDRVLKEVANFKPPESTSDSGTYELKDEAYDEVNPFFYHHTRNKREEVETVLRNRLKRKTNVEDPVLVPNPLGITSGPFSMLPSVFESKILHQIVFFGIYNVVSATKDAAPPSAEAILDQSLHLIMLAMLEKPRAFADLSRHKVYEEEQTVISILCTLESHKKYSKVYKARISWVLEHMGHYHPEEVAARRFVPAPATTVDPEEAKKRAAKARQEALMKQMKAQQASFATTFEDMDDDEDEDITDDTSAPASYGTCIVCQEGLNASKAFGSLGLLQPSRLVRRWPEQWNMNDVLGGHPDNLDRTSDSPVDNTFPPVITDQKEWKKSAAGFHGFPPSWTRFGIHSSVCSHMMHLDCFMTYSASIRQRHRAQATRNHPENILRKEYICPLCKCLGNVILPVIPSDAPPQLTSVPFADWVRASGIGILKSKPDPQLEAVISRTSTGEFAFWSAQDPTYQPYLRTLEKADPTETHKMVDTVMVIAKIISAQTKHLRDGPEPPIGERGAGVYLPEELVAYTVSSLEIAQRGLGQPGTTVADSLTDSQQRMIQGLLVCLQKLSALSFKNRPDEGREAIRQALIKRLLPEWSRSSFTSFRYPLILRDPFVVLVETAAVAPDMLKHVLILTYYAHLARTVVGILFVLNKNRSAPISGPAQRRHEDIFGDIRMFFMSVIRPSPLFEHSGEVAFQAFGEARIEKLLYAYTLPFLRRAAILCRAVLPSAFPTPPFQNEPCEYRRLLTMLDIPPLSDLPNQDTLQNALSGWCAAFGDSPHAVDFNCSLLLEHPMTYRIAKLPLVLDTLFTCDQEKLMMCKRCKTVPQDAAICLLCGATVCFQSHCCMDIDNQGRGECSMHMRECSGPIGIYFLVKRCSMLYLYANNGTFSQSPYLDVHGEVDVSMRRGRRQYLHSTRYEDIRKNWLSHGIPTLIARKLESTVDQGGWESL